MNAGILGTLREDGELDDIADEELIARVEARLPRYLLSRAVVRSPLAAAAAALIGLAAVQGGGTEPTAASPTTTTTPIPAVAFPTTAAPPVFGSPVPSFPQLTPGPIADDGPGAPPSTETDEGGSGAGPTAIDCAAKPLLDLTGPLLQTLKATTGLVPGTSTQIVLEAATGCAAGDPALLLLGVLVEFGSALPDLGFEVPPLNVPYVELPAPLLDALAPAWDAVGPVCTAVGQLPLIALIGLDPYPGGLDEVGLTAINQIINVCAQLDPS